MKKKKKTYLRLETCCVSRATAAAAAPVLLFQCVEVAWGLVEEIGVCGRHSHRRRRRGGQGNGSS